MQANTYKALLWYSNWLYQYIVEIVNSTNLIQVSWEGLLRNFSGFSRNLSKMTAPLCDSLQIIEYVTAWDSASTCSYIQVVCKKHSFFNELWEMIILQNVCPICSPWRLLGYKIVGVVYQLLLFFPYQNVSTFLLCSKETLRPFAFCFTECRISGKGQNTEASIFPPTFSARLKNLLLTVQS